MKALLAGEKELVAQYLMAKIPDFVVQAGYEAIGVVDGDRIIGGVIYSNFRKVDIEISCAGDGLWLTRGFLFDFFDYPFNQLGCHRVTSLIPKGNRRSRRFCQKIGFTEEGRVRQGTSDRQDLMVYGMLKHECRWIEYGQKLSVAA